ncbi:hypothetical protein [Anaerosporobacter faecicola]|uniref:hypothetical protein n=1 Tax=Anaerosporobacter faecicola TaxID=2718714 RepID=UPI00143B0A57|nr:hypothetical protein [Anaerosporobacter faecicola]
MEKDRLIEEIVSELLNRLSKEMWKTENKGSLRVCIIGEWKQPYATCQDFERIPLSSYDPEEDEILITAMSPCMMANLANGIAQSTEEKMIQMRLLQGKNVYVLRDAFLYQQYKKTAFKAYYHLYQDYEIMLCNYGLQIIDDVSELLQERGNRQYQFLMNSCKIEPKALPKNKIGRVDWRKKHLLLEKDFVNGRIDTSRIVWISQDCIITPMARDYIREHQIQIERG